MNTEKVKIKICGLRRAVDVDLALRLGASYIGFNRYKGSPRFVDNDTLLPLLESVPINKRVLVDVMTDPVALEHYSDWGFDYFQIHFDHDISRSKIQEWSAIVGSGRLWLTPRIPSGVSFPEDLFTYGKTFVFDAFSQAQFGGSGKRADWNAFRTLKSRFPDYTWVLAGGLTPFNVADAVRSTGADIVDVASGVEESPGKKSAKALRDFFSELG